jgi:phosphoglycolate phosphatase-like HAD superfamily hydrolase
LEAAGASSFQEIHDRLVGSGNVVSEISRSGVSRAKLLQLTLASAGPPPVYEGVGDVIGELSQRGMPLAIATNLPGTLAMPMLEMTDLGSRFSSVIHAGICRTPKPHPRSILLTLNGLGILPSANVYYVGDRLSDAEAAASAGISMAWVKHGYEQPLVKSGVRPVSAFEILDL